MLVEWEQDAHLPAFPVRGGRGAVRCGHRAIKQLLHRRKAWHLGALDPLLYQKLGYTKELSGLILAKLNYLGLDEIF